MKRPQNQDRNKYYQTRSGEGIVNGSPKILKMVEHKQYETSPKSG